MPFIDIYMLVLVWEVLETLRGDSWIQEVGQYRPFWRLHLFPFFLLPLSAKEKVPLPQASDILSPILVIGNAQAWIEPG